MIIKFRRLLYVVIIPKYFLGIKFYASRFFTYSVMYFTILAHVFHYWFQWHIPLKMFDVARLSRREVDWPSEFPLLYVQCPSFSNLKDKILSSYK